MFVLEFIFIFYQQNRSKGVDTKLTKHEVQKEVTGRLKDIDMANEYLSTLDTMVQNAIAEKKKQNIMFSLFNL